MGRDSRRCPTNKFKIIIKHQLSKPVAVFGSGSNTDTLSRRYGTNSRSMAVDREGATSGRSEGTAVAGNEKRASKEER